VEAEAEELDHRVGFVGTVLFVAACLFGCMINWVSAWLASDKKKYLIFSRLDFHGFPAVHPTRSPRG
jgi:hypothetical protein